MATPTITLQDCRDVFYWILREYQDVQAYPLFLADKFINLAQLKFCSGKIRHPFDPSKIARKGKLPFLNSFCVYESVGPTYLTSRAPIDVVWSITEINVSDSSLFPNEGMLFIDGSLVLYNGITWTSFNNISGIKYWYKEWTRVDIAYSLPDDFMSPKNLVFNNRRKIHAMQYDDVFENLNWMKNSWYWNNYHEWNYYNTQSLHDFYCIFDEKAMLIFTNTNGGEDFYHLRYEKLPTIMVDKDDLVTIDNDHYSSLVIWYLAVAEMFYNRWEEDRGVQLMNIAISHAKELYSLYNNKLLEDQNWQQYRTSKGSGRNY